MEQGESESEAMRREIKEETGLLVSKENLQYHGKIFVRHGGYDLIYHAFSAKFDSRPAVAIDAYEHQEFGWFPPRQALSLNLVEDLDACLKIFHGVEA